MQKENLRIIYEDDDLLVIDKPAGVIADDFKKRAHRLDKDTSGVLLIAKNSDALKLLQDQFKNSKVEKKYIALVMGSLKNDKGIIEALIDRSPNDRRKQKVYLPGDPATKKKELRKAITEYKVIQRFEDYTLVEAYPKTGRKHQIRCHLSYLNHPIAGDKLYGFKNQPCPEGLNRQFLHAKYLKITLPNGGSKEFSSDLPEDLKTVLNNLK